MSNSRDSTPMSDLTCTSTSSSSTTSSYSHGKRDGFTASTHGYVRLELFTDEIYSHSYPLPPPNRWGAILTRHIGQKEAKRNQAVRDFINNDVWDDIKFITKEADLDPGGVLYQMAFKVNSHVPEKNKPTVWGNIRECINPMLKVKRNNINAELRKCVLGKSAGEG